VSTETNKKIFDLAGMRDRTHVFVDRRHAGEVLADMLKPYHATDTLVLAIPAGGIPVAAALAGQLNLLLDVAVVSKITLPWNSEAGYGAVAFDGTTILNEELVGRVGLSEAEIQKGISQTKEKVAKRLEIFQPHCLSPDCACQQLILVDDGLASGYTMQAAISALRSAGAQSIILAVPTAHQEAVEEFRRLVEVIYCPNIRSGLNFAVADAYQEWTDVSEQRAVEIFAAFNQEFCR